MKIILMVLLAAIATSSFSQCPKYVNTNTTEIKQVVSHVEKVCNIKLNEDTISSLNVYYYASTDKSVIVKFELLKAKRNVNDTTIDMPAKVLKMKITAPAENAQSIFEEMKKEVKTCSSFKIKNAMIKYGDETAVLENAPGNKKRITVY